MWIGSLPSDLLIQKQHAEIKSIFLVWSLIIATIGGIYGIAALDLPFFGLYSLPPAPLLGQPIGYQTLSSCGQPVCPSIVQNSIALATLDFAICFSIAFLISFVLFSAFQSSLLSSSKMWKRNILPIISLAIVSLIATGAAYSSVSNGASFSELHWYGGVMAEHITNMQIYAGNASSQNLQGTAYMTLSVTSNYWDELNVTISATVLTFPVASNNNSDTTRNTPLSSNPVSFYQCSNLRQCQVITMIHLPPYSLLSLSNSTSALYFGSSLTNNETVSYVMTFSNGQSISGQTLVQ